MKRKNLPHEIQVAQLNLACSHFLEYNKQRISRSQENNGRGLFQAQNLQKTQNHNLKVFVETSNTADAFVSKLNYLKISDANHNNHDNQSEHNRKSLIEDFKKHINPINVNTITSSNFLKDLKQKEEVNFQNSNLNEEYNFVKNKLTLSQLQRRRSGQLAKSSHKQQLPNFPQSQIRIQAPNYQDWNHPLIAKKDAKIDESIVLQKYKPTQLRVNQQGQIKINSRSIEILVLAVISAIFVSLGSNFKTFLLGQ